MSNNLHNSGFFTIQQSLAAGLCLCLLVAGCQPTVPPPAAPEAFAAADEALHYYQAIAPDSAKYQAVQYLRQQFAQAYGEHYTDTASANAFFNHMYLLVENNRGVHVNMVDSVLALADAYLPPQVSENRYKAWDRQALSTGLLKEHVEYAFAAREKYPWCARLPDSLFYAYVLPYRVANEPLTPWRKQFFQQYDSLISAMADTLTEQALHQYMFQQTQAVFKIQNQLGARFHKDLGIDNALKVRMGFCNHRTQLQIAMERSVGLPVVMDVVPRWGNRSSGHSWSALVTDQFPQKITNLNGPVSTNDIIMDQYFDAEVAVEDLPPGMYVQHAKTVPKIYRKESYTVSEDTLAEALYPLFTQNHYVDDTERYIKTADVSLALPEASRHHYLYLCVFHTTGWQPVAYTVPHDNQVLFPQVGPYIIYTVCALQDKRFVPLTPPFIPDTTNALRFITPNLAKRRNMKLVRKYPLFGNIADHASRMRGGSFQASNDSTFQRCVTLHSVDYTPFYRNAVVVDSQQKYQYLRYRFAPDDAGFVADVRVPGMRTTGYQVMGSPAAPDHPLAHAFDDDLLSYARLPTQEEQDVWIGLKFDQPIAIDSITFWPRNDLNCIMPDNTYELFYWDDRWVSLGEKVAQSYDLQYANAPEGALFWLRNLTTGQEERIFTYENDIQVWW